MTAALRLLGEGEVIVDPIILDAEDRDALVGIDLEEVLLTELEVEGLDRGLLRLLVTKATDGTSDTTFRLSALRLRLAGEILLDPDADLVLPAIRVHHDDRRVVKRVARFDGPLLATEIRGGDGEGPGALGAAERLHVEDLDSVLELSTVTVELVDKGLEHIEVELVAQDGEIDDLVEVGTTIIQHVLAVLADELDPEPLESDRVAEPARSVVEEALHRVLVVAGDDHHLVPGGEDTVEESQDRLLGVTVVELLELIEDDHRLLLDALHRPHEALVREGCVDDDGR